MTEDDVHELSDSHEAELLNEELVENVEEMQTSQQPVEVAADDEDDKPDCLPVLTTKELHKLFQDSEDLDGRVDLDPLLGRAIESSVDGQMTCYLHTESSIVTKL